MGDDRPIASEAELRALYGAPNPVSLAKELDRITPDYRAFLEAAPFLVIASVGPEGLDASPRGDPAPVATVLDERTVAIPDRPGNNRIDTLLNIVRDPRVALIFLIPGVGETMRINGRARISVAPDLLDRLAMKGRQPRSVILVEVERIYLQCQKALMRSGLWSGAAQLARSALPSTGAMLERITAGTVDGAAYDADYPERMARTIY